MEFLEASRLGSNRASRLLNHDLLQLFSLSPLKIFLKCLRKASIYRSLGWVSDTWWSLIGDTCHSLIGPLMSLLTRAGLLVSSLTRARLLVSSLTHAPMRDWFLHDTWQISVGL